MNQGEKIEAKSLSNHQGSTQAVISEGSPLASYQAGARAAVLCAKN